MTKVYRTDGLIFCEGNEVKVPRKVVSYVAYVKLEERLAEIEERLSKKNCSLQPKTSCKKTSCKKTSCKKRIGVL